MNRNNSIQREQENIVPTLTRQFRANNLENELRAVQVPETYTYARAIGEEGIPATAVPTIATRLPPIARINRIDDVPQPESEPESESEPNIPVVEEIPNYVRRAYRELRRINSSSITGIVRGASSAATYNLLPGGRIEVVTQAGYVDPTRNIRESRNISNIYIVDVDAYNQWRNRPRTPEQSMARGFFNRFIRRR